MKFKLDENLGRRGAELLRAAGHDVATVHDQGMSGATNIAPWTALRPLAQPVGAALLPRLIMRVVLDTNTQVSAVLSANGPPSDVG